MPLPSIAGGSLKLLVLDKPNKPSVSGQPVGCRFGAPTHASDAENSFGNGPWLVLAITDTRATVLRCMYYVIPCYPTAAQKRLGEKRETHLDNN